MLIVNPELAFSGVESKFLWWGKKSADLRVMDLGGGASSFFICQK